MPDYPSAPFQGVLVFAFILETLCFSLKRYFSRTLEDSDVGNYALSLFLILKAIVS